MNTGTVITTARVGLIALASLAGIGLSTPTTHAEAIGNTGGIVFSEILVSSYLSGRTVATTRTDGHGNFRFDLPVGNNNICLDGPGVRSVIERSGTSQGEAHTIHVQIGLNDHLDLTIPANASGQSQDGRRGPSPVARDLCFPYTIHRDGKPIGENNGAAEPRVDPRIPPPAPRAAPNGPAALQTVGVTGTISLGR